MAATHRDEFALLTGRSSGSPYPPGIAPLGGKGKFTPDGAVQHWPGNTFVCHINRASTAYEVIRALQEEVKKSPFNRFFTFLPPPSFHMTVYQGLSPGMTPDTGWPRGIPTGQSRDEVTDILLKRLRQVSLPTDYRIRVDRLFAGYSLKVSGADDREESALRHARVALRDATGITFADFDDYGFHITLAYLIDWLSDSTAQELLDFGAEIGRQFLGVIGTFDLGPVEFCNFDTMHHFEVLKTLA